MQASPPNFADFWAFQIIGGKTCIYRGGARKGCDKTYN